MKATFAKPEYRCATCSKIFRRRAHLKRHSESHTSARPYACPLCHRTFQRTDVLQRHQRTCEGSSSAVPLKRRACDWCVRQKKACTLQDPCDNCAKKGILCLYSFGSYPDFHGLPVSSDGPPRAADDESAAMSAPPLSRALESADSGSWGKNASTYPSRDGFVDFSSLMFSDGSMCWTDIFTWDGSQTSQTSTSPNRKYDQCFKFLERFTRTTGLIQSFECGTYHERKQAMGEDKHIAEGCGPKLHDRDNTISGTAGSSGPSDLAPALDPLHWNTHQIILLVKEVATVKPRNSVVTLSWSSALETMCFQFFSPPNLRKFLKLFWTIWHPNVNFIHRPTFDTSGCKTILLASMVLIGACVSPDRVDAEHAAHWFNCVEEMVFTDVDLSSDFMPTTVNRQALNTDATKLKIQALQAAYNVCLFQNWEGSDTSKRRIRRHRFGTVISVARDIGISKARHKKYNHVRDEFRWHEWVAQEELIRVFLWIFLLDNAFVIFNNLPPRLMIKEATLHMASPEACFLAPSQAECLDSIQQWAPTDGPVSQLSYLNCIEIIRQECVAMETRRFFAFLGPLNLFALTSALHALIFQYQHSFGEYAQLLPIRNALHNWGLIWKIYCDEFSTSPPHVLVTEKTWSVNTMGDRVGFSQHACEFWLLAKLMMDYITKADRSKSGGVSGLFEQASLSVSDDPTNPLLHDYDQTSMQQVNDLINTFQQVNIR